jgi:hypothetical protein
MANEYNGTARKSRSIKRRRTDMKKLMKWLSLGLLLVLAVTQTGLPQAADTYGPSQEWSLVTPLGEIQAITYESPADRLADLNGKSITLIDNTKPGADMLMPMYVDLLKQRFPEATFTILRKSYGWSGMKDTFDPDFQKEVVESSDAVIYGVGD